VGAKVMSDDQVRELRTRCVVNGESFASLARAFGISKDHARRVAIGDFRVSAGGPLYEPRAQQRERYRAFTFVTELSAEDRELARRLLADGGTPENVAAAMMCPLAEIRELAGE
jgi:hypothetical protein